MQILDLTDKLARFPIAYGYQPVRGWSVKHFDTPTGTSFQRTKQNALGEGPWDACERLYVDAFPIDPADFVFHPGDANDTPDANFPADPPHPWTAYLSAKCRAGISEDQTEKLFGIYRTLRTGNYNGSGQQLNSVGSIVTPSDPRTEFFFKNNPANVAVDQILRWGLRLNNIINWPAWVNWRDYNDELIPIDDSTYTPRSLSLTPTTGGTLTPGTYYVRVSTMKSGDESSASLRTIEVKANKIVLTSGQTAFQVNWLIKGDENVPPTNPSGITGYRIYIGTVPDVWLGYFTVSNPASRTFIITTTTGPTAGNPLELATSGLLTNVKRFECGLFFIPPYDLGQALDQICQISCADWQWSGLGTGTYRNDKVRFLSPADRSPVFTLNLAETGMGSLKTYPVDRRNRPNQVVVNFRDQDDEFLGPAQPVILDREQLQTDDGLIKTQTIEGGTMRRNQAQRVASFYARVLCDMDQMATMLASPKTYHLLPGDVFNVTNPMPNWTDQKFIVRKKSERVETSLGDDILGQVYTNGLYSDTDYAPLPLPLPTPRLDPFAAPPVATNLVLTEIDIVSPDFSFSTGFNGTFDFGTFFAPQIARVYVKGPSSTEPPDSAYNEVQILVPRADNTGFFEFRGLAGGHYWVKVVTESSLGNSASSGHPVEDIQLSVPLVSILKVIDTIPKRSMNDGLGLYIAVGRDSGVGSWFGAKIWRDRGYGYEPILNIIQESHVGHSTNNGDTWLAATAGKIYFQVEGEVTFNPTNATTLEIANGKNNLLIGREKIGVQTWTNLGGGLWKGENLVRGMDDTDHLQATHTAQEDIIVLDETVIFFPMEPRDMDMTINFKAVTLGLLLASTTAVSLTYNGNSVITHPPRFFDGYFASDAGGNLLVDWEPGYDGPGRESYDLEFLSSPGGSVIRGPIDVTPIQLDRTSSVPPLKAITGGALLPGSAFTFIEPGGFDAQYTDEQWNTSAVVMLVESLSTFDLSGGFILEVQVSEFSDINGLFPSFIGILKTDNTSGIGWTKAGSINPDVIVPLGADPLTYFYHMLPGDRFAVHVQPDGTVVYYINYLGAMSDPWYVSPTKLDLSLTYKLQFRNDPYPTGLGSSFYRVKVRNTRWLRNIPEFVYTGAMQKADNSGSLPTNVYARIRQKSLYAYGKPSDWVAATFTR